MLSLDESWGKDSVPISKGQAIEGLLGYVCSKEVRSWL